MRTKNTVVVITGASSGIGRATALAFAGKGATVVLGARRGKALQQVAEECQERGGRALAVPTEVTDEAAVEELGRQAIKRFGSLDVWVNNASVSVYGPFLEVPMEDFRRVLDVDVMGYVYGARTALRQMREQGRGVLVNVSSIASIAPMPYTTAYSMAKAAVTAMSASLRQELRLAGERKVKVCTVLPATVDTPFFQHAANYTGRRVVAMPPVYPPAQVADTILGLVRNPKDEVVVGGAARAMRREARRHPQTAERAMARQADRAHLSRDEHAPAMSGSLHVTSSGLGEVEGGWGGRRRTATRRVVAIAAAGAVTGAVVAAANRASA
ncbi:SDR family oxidoreductase [Spirillospora sp. NPDC047279]|uniref:SDR family oxidoreductase n=1 Tax=Spirillospora sp. NPDC047279 TaxID=3155478 RepID=UPI00340CFAB5